MRFVERILRGVVDHRRVAILMLVVLLAAVGTGVTQLEEDAGVQVFEVGSTEEEKLEYVRSNFSTGQDDRTVAQVVVRDDDVLDRASLLTILEMQRSIEHNETVAPTLAEDPATASIATVVATAALQHRHPGAERPTVDEQIRIIEAMDQAQIDAVIRRVLAADRSDGADAFAFMPDTYDSGTTEANATMVVVFQTSEVETAPTNAPDRIVDSQTAIQRLAADATDGESVLVVGNGVVTDETRQSRSDTFAIVGPLALLFVLLTLVVVYRDPFDIGLSLVGIVLVQVWTFGALGWVGIPFNPVLIAIPVLLIGLSIDYGIHVFMRYRERRSHRGEDAATAMRHALPAVGVALVWVTVTTVVGFLSNLASPVAPIRELGLISAIGIVGALVVFGLFVPPLKVELDALVDRLGLPRDQRPIGTGGGKVATVLSLGSTAARKAPIAVVVLALVLTLVTTAGATQVSTSFEPEDNIPEDAPEWMGSLPEAFQPGEYTARENLRYANEHFLRHGSQAEVLVEGDVTAPDTLKRVAAAEREAGEQPVTVILANGEPRTVSPLTVMERVAARNESFNATFQAADTDGDGVPDENLGAVYDALYAAAPEQASRVLHREDGEYVALRVAVSVNPEADGRDTTDQMQQVAAHLDGDGLAATATGRPIIDQLVQDYLLETLLTSLFVTLLVVAAVLAAVYRLEHGSATLGLVTLVPVAAVVSWVVGTMYVIGYPLSVLTTIVASITVGIGIDYSIHVSERFSDELDAATTVGDAIATTTRGTGAALFGSAVTTAAGLGVLAVALHPTLQQFGTITAIMIVYAFLASVLVLPSLLVLWARHLAPDDVTAAADEPSTVSPGAAGD
jgi:hydrophobe/amphiphile efflux-3 (HAE3) family protein